MDTGEYDTNTLLINNLACIAYRIYEPVASQSSTYTFNASDVEDALRNNGHLVYMDAVRRGIWCFYLLGKDGASSKPPEQLGLTAKMEVCGYPLSLVEEGNFEPATLLKSLSAAPHSINTPGSSSSSGSAFDMPARGAQALSLPPTTVATGAAATMENQVIAGTIPDIKGYNFVPVREVHEFFIKATLSSLTTAFCHQIGAIPLNHRSVLLPSQVFQHDDGDFGQLPRRSAIATFRIYLTTTGSLIISLCVSLLQGLISSADALRSSLLTAGPDVLAAPLGAFGTMQRIVDAESHVAEGGYGQSPDTQISRLRQDTSDKFSQWKSTCARLLQMRGMSPSLLDGCAWLNIQFLQRRPYELGADGKRTPLMIPGPVQTAPWPSVLCFRKPKMEASFDARLERGSSTGGFENADTVAGAKDWCMTTAEREEAQVRRAKERDAISKSGDTSGLGPNDHQGNGYSPLNIRRSSNGGTGAAAGMMYPTPPDGVQQLGATPSFDGAMLSPGNQQSATTAAEMEQAVYQPAPTGDGLDEAWNVSEPKREPPGPAFLEGENIFGDLGENMFEGNELTDADFNFFDDQPGGSMELPQLTSMAPDMHMAMDISQDVPEPSAVVKQGDFNGISHTAVPIPQFTKPELKHARSTLAEESRQISNLENYNVNSTMGVKRHLSPFNPDTVYKRIRASLPPSSLRQQPVKTTPTRRRSVFEKVTFDPSLSLTNKKYQESGPFNYTLPTIKGKETNQHESAVSVTTPGIPSQARKLRNLKDLPSNISLLLSRISGSTADSPMRGDDFFSDSGGSDLDSDEGNLSDTTGAASSPAKSSVMRKRPDDDATSMAASFKDLENASTGSPGYGHIDLSRLSSPEIPELSLTRYFADPEPAALQPMNSDSDLITIAQILTEQAASGSLRLSPRKLCPGPGEVRRNLANAVRYSIQGLRKALPQSLSGATECQLRPLVEVQDMALPLPQPNRAPPRPVGQELIKPPIFQICSPHVELRRHETQLSLLPSAVSLWESLGLGPSKGPKDVVSVCVFPYLEGMRESAAAFVERVRSTYESLKLGTFEPFPPAPGVVDGLFPFIPDNEGVSPELGMPRAGTALADNMLSLVQALVSSTLTEKNFVVYFIYSADNPSSIVESCTAFWELFEHYKRAMVDRKKSILNDLVLQLIPSDLVASDTSVVVLTPGESVRLCLETYDRCTLFGGAMPAPAIILEQALPNKVDFKLTTTPSPNLLRENSCIHIAYAQSVDERWISAAWTDNQGSKQMTASYCLGRRGRPLSTPVSDVVHEIWDTTSDLISMWKVHWRFVITKCGPMDQHEVDTWISLAKGEQPKASVSLLLMTVETNPSLQLIPPLPKVPLTAPAVFYTTPVSTPQPSMVSPDQNGNPPTPMAGGSVNATTPGGNETLEVDADATLVDITDTTWGVIMSHRLNNSTSLTDLNPSLASGYLIKRSGAWAEDGPVAMEVNIVHSESDPRAYDRLLREMLVYFRGLGTLARARGMVDKDGDVRPWHVAAAEKAARALYLLM